MQLDELQSLCREREAVRDNLEKSIALNHAMGNNNGAVHSEYPSKFISRSFYEQYDLEQSEAEEISELYRNRKFRQGCFDFIMYGVVGCFFDEVDAIKHYSIHLRLLNKRVLNMQIDYTKQCHVAANNDLKAGRRNSVSDFMRKTVKSAKERMKRISLKHYEKIDEATIENGISMIISDKDKYDSDQSSDSDNLDYVTKTPPTTNNNTANASTTKKTIGSEFAQEGINTAKKVLKL